MDVESQIKHLIEDPNVKVDEVLQYLHNMIVAAWKEYEESKRPIDKHRFLKMIPEAAKIFVELLQTTGRIEKAASVIEHKTGDKDFNQIVKRVFPNSD
jgi:hypothetical protein